MRETTQMALALTKRYEVPMAHRSKAIELILAEAIASRLALPTTRVNSTNDYFVAHHKVEALDLLGAANEHAVIDIDRAANLVYQIWRIRYGLVHQPNDTSIGRVVSFAMAANTLKIPGDFRDLIKDYPKMAFGRYDIQDSQELPDE